jgi:hypothetical protein
MLRPGSPIAQAREHVAAGVHDVRMRHRRTLDVLNGQHGVRACDVGGKEVAGPIGSARDEHERGLRFDRPHAGDVDAFFREGALEKPSEWIVADRSDESGVAAQTRDADGDVAHGASGRAMETFARADVGDLCIGKQIDERLADARDLRHPDPVCVTAGLATAPENAATDR